jgi:hypothetical protein
VGKMKSPEPGRIVTLLRAGPLTRREIEARLAADTATVLREITNARAAGHVILALPTGAGTVFELRETPAPPKGG